jgi:hypothetical protein
MRMCLAEYDSDGRVIRIFRTRKAAVQSPAWDTGHVLETPRAEAVDSIRRQVFTRAGYRCENPTCRNPITWDTGDLHERQPRGKLVKVSAFEYQGGEVSVANGVCLCHNCHMDDPVAGHGKRKVRFGESAQGI